MRNALKLIVACVVVGCMSSLLHADPLQKMAKKMAKKLQGEKNKKIAVLNFPYHNGYVSSGSTLVQERLTTYLSEQEQVELIERLLIEKVLAEINLGQTGIIDEKTTKQIGKVLGVGAVVTGTLNDLEKSKTEVNARIVTVETGKILAAGMVKIKRTWTDTPQPPKGIQPVVDKPVDKPGEFLGTALIELAILLDTSGSMDGLINQAKTQLWKIINELASSEKDGSNPVNQVALYEYGNSNLSSDEQYIRQILPFTEDLDVVSENLFSLTTSGGDEYCGAVIADAVRNLQWDKHVDVYKAIFIAGNEPFTQGPVDFRTAIAEAKQKGVFINTIFCGKKQEGIGGQWLAGAQSGNGEYLNIDQQAQVVAITAPQDDKIQQLGQEYNKTTVAYGQKGKVAEKRLEEQDKEAEVHALSGAQTQRALFKAKKQYSSAATWDLNSAYSNNTIKLEDIKKESLPEELQSMNEQELKAYLEKKKKEREEIQEKINTLNEERKKYITQKRKEMAESGEKTLDTAIIDAVRSQAVKKNYKFKE